MQACTHWRVAPTHPSSSLAPSFVPLGQVCVRFRPGDRGAGKLQLPLHQRLKIHTSEDPIVDKEPPEFLDALMNTRMSQPVLLPDSQKCVCLLPLLACVRACVCTTLLLLFHDMLWRSCSGGDEEDAASIPTYPTAMWGAC